jgi:hypothetical protein
MEHMMAAARSLSEFKPPQKIAEIIEADVRIGCSLQYCKQKLLMFAHLQYFG